VADRKDSLCLVLELNLTTQNKGNKVQSLDELVTKVAMTCQENNSNFAIFKSVFRLHAKCDIKLGKFPIMCAILYWLEVYLLKKYETCMQVSL
jgi:hemoglobin-like flavoprotein